MCRQISAKTDAEVPRIKLQMKQGRMSGRDDSMADMVESAQVSTAYLLVIMWLASRLVRLSDGEIGLIVDASNGMNQTLYSEAQYPSALATAPLN